MIGTVLGNRYKIISKLGSGGMAWVFLAEDQIEGRRVAVKVLYPQHGQDINFIQRFTHEARLAMALSESAPSAKIARVLDYGSDRDTHYLVMDYVPGQDLLKVLAEKGPLPWQEALEITRQVAVALEHAHQQDVVHRDIKPGNIMVCPDGTVRVLDFGIARARGSPELTLSGFVGSPHYAAPEQAMGEEVDIRADIYSLGIVLYRMLSGKLPFQSNTPWAVVNEHITTPPPPLHESNPDLPEPVVQLVEKALAKRPEARFRSPARMVKAIEAVLAGRDLPADEQESEPCASSLSSDELYQCAQEAIESESWQEAVELFGQILKLDPDYADAAEQLDNVGQKIRLAAHYRAARRALEMGHWQETLDQLDEIAEIEPGYRDIADLRAQAKAGQQLIAEERDAVADHPTQIDRPGPAQVEASPPARSEPEGSPIPAPPPPPAGGSQRRNWLWLLVAILLAAVLGGALLLLDAQQPAIVAHTSTPTASSPAPTSTPSATSTARPSPTRAAPSPTTTAPATAEPTVATPTASPSATASVTASATPTPTPDLQPPVRDELTGQIAFARFDATRNTYDVHVCAVDGSDCSRLVAEASQPDFLPGGSQIVVHSWRPDDKGLFLHVLDEQRIWRISDRIEAARPSVDFQGLIYVYHSRQEADRQARLYRTYGPETRPIRRGADVVLGSSPAWTPDGRILYTGCWQDACGILIMDAEGNQTRQLVAGSTETNPESSPNGRKVAFMSLRDGNWEIYTINIDGSNLRRLTRNPANDGLPTWSPDGTHLAFVSDRGGSWAVWAMRANGSEQRRLFAIDGPLEGTVQGAAPHELHGWVEERITWSEQPVTVR